MTVKYMNINLFVTHLERDLADNCVLCNTCGDITGQLAGFCSCSNLLRSALFLHLPNIFEVS